MAKVTPKLKPKEPNPTHITPEMLQKHNKLFAENLAARAALLRKLFSDDDSGLEVQLGPEITPAMSQQLIAGMKSIGEDIGSPELQEKAKRFMANSRLSPVSIRHYGSSGAHSKTGGRLF